MNLEILEERKLLVIGVSALPHPPAVDSQLNGVAFISQSGNAGSTCSSSLLEGGRHLLTAAHCFGDTAADADTDNWTARFQVPSGEVFYSIDSSDVVVHALWDGAYFEASSGYDLAVITLPSIATMDANRYEIHRDFDDVGEAMLFAGYGLTGTGDGTIPIGGAGTLRVASNDFGPDLLSGPRILLSDFDSGNPAEDNLGDGTGFPATEGHAHEGDSGGPAFLPNLEIAGITSARANDPLVPGLFGDVNGFTRVSWHAALIDFLTSQPDDIVLDMSKQPDGDDGAPDVIEASQAGANFRLTVNGSTAWIGPIGQVNSLTVLGSGDDETILLQDATSFPVTLDGQGGDDTLEGHAGDELLVGGPDSDELRGRGGNDILYGGDGPDTIEGGNGNDFVFGQTGDDVLDGNGGTDFVLGGDGNDIVEGGNAGDTLNGEAGNDTVRGQGGDDWVVGGADDDTVRGGAGNDFLIGGLLSLGAVITDEVGSDLIVGGSGNDTVRGDSVALLALSDLGNQGGNDTIMGGTGHDTVIAQAGNDSVSGGAGADSVEGNAGDDWLNGESGEDSVRGGRGADIVRGGDAADDLNGGSGGDIVLGGDGGDAIRSGSGRDLVVAGRGPDRVNGGSGGDLLIAGTTDHDADDAALGSMLAEWSSSRSYRRRIQNLQGVGNKSFPQRLNGDNYLVLDDTVLNDQARDVLTGSAGLDWFFYDPALDRIVDLEARERTN